MINKNTSIAVAIIFTFFLSFSPFCDAQSIRDRIKQRVQSVKESVQSEFSLGQTEANSKQTNQTNQTKTAPSSQTQKQDVVPTPRTINELAEMLGCSPEQAAAIIKRIPEGVTKTRINGIEVNIEKCREAASQIKETAPFQKVDLGLSVLWASSNIGASSPEGYGNYLAWGAVLPPSHGDGFGEWRSYIWNDPNGEFKKYDESDKKTRLELVDDVAQYRYGGGWRVPTNEEILELKDNCNWSWQEQNGVWGYKVTGPNGNSIFLPAGGYNPSNYIMQKNECGMYWSSEIGSARQLGMMNAEIDYQRGCYLVFFRGGSINVSSGSRNNGLLVRAVWDDALVSPKE